MKVTVLFLLVASLAVFQLCQSQEVPTADNAPTSDSITVTAEAKDGSSTIKTPQNSDADSSEENNSNSGERHHGRNRGKAKCHGKKKDKNSEKIKFTPKPLKNQPTTTAKP